jgi:hypothetical protein
MILRFFSMMWRIDLGARGPFEVAPQLCARFLDMRCETSIFDVQEEDISTGNTELRACGARLPLSQVAQLALLYPPRVGGRAIGEKTHLDARAQRHLARDRATATQDFVVRMGRDDPGVGP